MVSKLDLLTASGTYALHEVDALGNQTTVVDGHSVYVADTGSQGHNIGIALAALGAILDLGHLAWPSLGYGFDWDT